MSLYLVTAAGGMIGALGRYGIGLAASRRGYAAYKGTLIINLLGAFLIGVIAALHQQYGLSTMYTFTVTGILGGFTTFSTLAVQVAGMLANHSYREAVTYGGTTLLVGILLTAAGYFVMDILT